MILVPESAMLRRALLVFVWLLLAACSNSREVSVVPATLPEIESQLPVRALWSERLKVADSVHATVLWPVIDRNTVYVAASDGTLRALDSDNGDRRWLRETAVSLSSGLGDWSDRGADIDATMLVVGGHDGEVLAVRRSDGVLLWRSQVSSEVLAPPLLLGDVVVVHSIDGKLTGLDSSDGHRRWVYQRSVPALSLHGSGAPLAYRGQVMAGFADGRMVALAPEDGRVLWETAVAVARGRSELERLVDVDARPVVMDDILYAVAYQGRLVAIKVTTGRLLWSREMSVFGGLTVDDDAVYVTDEYGAIWALDRHSGITLWEQQGLLARSVTAPIVYQDYIVVGDFEGYLHWLRRDDGDFASRYRAFPSAVALLQPDGDAALYAVSQKGVLKKIRADRSRGKRKEEREK